MKMAPWRFVSVVSALVGSATLGGSPLLAASPLDDLQSVAPQMRVFSLPGQSVSRLYGGPLSTGGDVYQSAEDFLRDHADVFGLRPENLILKMAADGMDLQPVMLDRETGQYKFIALYYGQVHEGLEVYGGELTLLFRNSAGFPLVETISNLKNVQGMAAPAGGFSAALAISRSGFGPDDPKTVRKVIFSNSNGGAGNQVVVAYTYIVTHGEIGDDIAIGIDGMPRAGTYDRRRVFVEAATGKILHSESLIRALDVEGNVNGWATPGADPDTGANPPAIMILPGIWVDLVGGNQGLTDRDGNYVIAHNGSDPVTVRSKLYGPALSLGVQDESGPEILLEQQVTPPGPADFLHNEVQTAADTAEVNAMLHASTIQTFVRDVNPDYPQLDRPFQAFVNVNSTCNAFYNGSAITFFSAGGSCPNTAYSSVIYHEYGHKLVADGSFSPTGDYHEGFADVSAQIVLDDPITGRGFFGPGQDLRTGDNDRQYPCTGPVHFCGQVLSGCVWHLREELTITEPSRYREIVADLAVNSVLLHAGGINPGITIDFLTLDDDDNDITNGTPHYTEINTAFGRHNMAAPPIQYLDFEFPNGRPTSILPMGGTTMRVAITPRVGEPKDGTGRLHVNDGNGWVDVAMISLGNHVYDAVFPEVDCPSMISFYVSAETTTGDTSFDPIIAPEITYTTIGASNVIEILMDDFETDLGWTVENENLAGGAWERGVPVGDGTNGDPTHDFDGSGSCFLTENALGKSDVDGGPTRLISPSFDLTTAEGFISYSYWFANDNNDVDHLRVEISNTGGDTWTLVRDIKNERGWASTTFRVSDYLTRSRDMKVRFSVADILSDSITEAAIDSVKIVMAGCGEPGDLFLEVTPLVVGEMTRMKATAATPGERVFFAYSLKGLGNTVVPQLNVTLGILNPKLAGAAQASNTGSALITLTVPDGARGLTVWIQAAQQGRVSEIVSRVGQ